MPEPELDLSQLMDDVVAAMATLRQANPLIQCLTNKVVTQITADVLLAVGAAPAMVDNPAEAGEFAAVASGVLINVGTPNDVTVAAMRRAVEEARGPWVLDPVAVGGLTYRTNVAHELLASSPTVIRGNASEIIALAGTGDGGRGVDSVDSVVSALPAASDLARRTDGAVGVSGPKDLVVAADARAVLITAGHELMPLVIGTGCALGALAAAYAAVCDDPFLAAVAAHAHAGAAGGVAGERSSAPGSFGVAWRDALYEMDASTMRGHVSLSSIEVPPALGEDEG